MKRHTDTQGGSPREDGAEIVVMLPETKGGQEPPEGARIKKDSHQGPPERARPCQHLNSGSVKLISDFWSPEL